MPTALETLAIYAPEAAADPRASAFLADAVLEMGDPERWGVVYNRAAAMLAAHAWAQSGPVDGSATAADASKTNGISAESAGELSVSYGALAPGVSFGSGADTAELASTKYGQTFLRLRASRAAGAARTYGAG